MKDRLFTFLALLGFIQISYSQNAQLEEILQFGGTSDIWVQDLAIDDSGNTYVSGRYFGLADFDPGPNVVNLPLPSGFNAHHSFVSKFDSTGQLEWALPFVDTVGLIENPFQFHPNGQLYVFGVFSGTADLDPGPGISMNTAQGSYNPFVLRLRPDGSLAKVTAIHTSPWSIRDMVTDENGNIYYTGRVVAPVDFDPGPDTFMLNDPGTMYISKLDSTGQFVWAKAIESMSFHGDAEGRKAEIFQNHIWLFGNFRDTIDADPGVGIHKLVGNKTHTVPFLLKLDLNGSFKWTGAIQDTTLTRIGGTIHSMAFGPQGDLFVAGAAPYGMDLDPGAGEFFQNVPVSTTNPYLIRLDSSGNFVNAILTGGQLLDIAVDSLNQVYGTGEFFHTDFDPGPGIFKLDTQGGTNNSDACFVKYDQNMDLVWCRALGRAFVSQSRERGQAIQLYNNEVYAAGVYHKYCHFYPWGKDSVTSWLGATSGYLLKLSENDNATNVLAFGCNGVYTSPSGKTWNVGGFYNDTIPSSSGGDSVLNINLNMRLSSSSINSVTHCGSYVSPSGKHVWNTSGQYRDTLTNQFGCDSIMLINLTINPNATSTVFDTVCSPVSSPSGKTVWSSSGTYLDTVPTPNGCNMFITTHLTVLDTNAPALLVTACNEYLSPSQNHLWTQSGVYIDTLFQGIGCNGVRVVDLTILNSPTTTINPATCEQYTSSDGSKVWTSSGIYSDTLQAANGCDSIVTVNLTILDKTFGSISPTTYCGSYTSPSGNHTWATSGTYSDTLVNSAGCDSILTVNLTVLGPTAASITPTACYSYTSPDGNEVWTTSGVYKDTLTNQWGCDSVVTVNLTINNASAATIAPQVCNQFMAPSGNHLWTNSGTYYDTLPNYVGCDSVITINLVILNPSSSSLTTAACETYTSPSGNQTWTVSGTYSDTLTNQDGCDSVLTINLTIDQPTYSNVQANTCTFYTSPSGKIWNTSGTYHDTIPNTVGCDSIITFNLTVHPQTSSLFSASSCIQYTSPSGKVWTVSGSYQDTIANSNGCDSTMTINLTILTVDTSVISIGTQLIALSSGAIGYQWLDCNNGYSPVIGATNATFTPSVNGSYAVVIVENGCVDTSGCHIISNIGIVENSLDAELKVYPNPTKGKVQIEFKVEYDHVNVKVFNPKGQAISNQRFEGEKALSIELSGAKGFYSIELTTDDGRNAVLKVLKQ